MMKNNIGDRYGQGKEVVKLKVVAPGKDGRKDGDSVKNLLDYVTGHMVENGCNGLGCSRISETAVKQFEMTKTVMENMKGIQCRHYLLSFKYGGIVDAGSIHTIAYYCGLYFWNYGWQVFYAVHENTDGCGLHIHYAVNSVNVFTGKKIPETKEFRDGWKDYIKNIDFNGTKLIVHYVNSYC